MIIIRNTLSCNHKFCSTCLNELNNVCPECICKLDYVIIKRNNLKLDRILCFMTYCVVVLVYCTCSTLITSVAIAIIYYFS